MKKLLSVLLAAAVFFSGVSVSFAATEPPVVTGETAILIDAATGKVLYEKNPDATRYPASTTKIITAILALENLEPDRVITVDDKTPYEVEGSHIALEPGEQLTVDQLLHAMMTESANDCALVLGKEISGTTEEFAKLMNETAKKLGAKNSNFVNPNGLHDDAHVSTAYDLAMIARYAMMESPKKEAFRELVTTYKYEIPPTNKKTETRYLYNTNRLLYDTVHKVTVNGVKRTCKYEGVTGIKTGYTSHAGASLVAGAQKDGTELIAVVMKSTDMGRFADCITMLDWGFTNYKTVSGDRAGTSLGEVKVKKGEVNHVEALLADDITATFPLEASEKLLKSEVVLDESVKAPIKKGQAIGTVNVYEGDTLIATTSAIAAKTVAEGGILSFVGVPDKTAKKIWIALLAAFLLLVAWMVVYILIKRRQVRLRKERRRQRAEQRRREELEKRKAWEEEYERRRRQSW